MARTAVEELSTKRNAIVDDFILWLAEHWLAIVIGLLALYAGLPWLAPLFMKLGWNEPAQAIYLAYSFMCHQLPQRSYFLLMLPMVVDGFTLMFGEGRFANRPYIDWRTTNAWFRPVAGWLGLQLSESFYAGTTLGSLNWGLRTLTGGLFGLASVWFAYPYIERAMRNIRRSRAPSQVVHRARRDVVVQDAMTARQQFVSLSSILAVLGLLLLALAGLTFYQQQRPAEPPPELAYEPTALPPILIIPTPYPTQTPYPTYTPYPGLLTPTPMPPYGRFANRPYPPATSPPTWIKIPSIGVDSKVVEVGWSAIEVDGKLTSVWDTADYAVGYHKTSGLPGQPGNMVLSGHNNIKGAVFRDLADVRPGDRISLSAAGYEYEYIVEDAFIVQEAGVSEEQRRQNARWIAPTSDERMTLVSCWPRWTNTHRVIVIARPYIPPTATEKSNQ
jgi:sortase A